MARYLYGGGGDGDIIQTTGLPYANAQATVWDARTGGSQITDLQTVSGTAVSSITTDGYGQAIFYGPDTYIATLWLQFASGPRWGLSPKAVDLAATRALVVQRSNDNTNPAKTVKAALPYSANAPLEQNLATTLDPLVIPRYASASARDAAFPSPTDGDRVHRTDLGCDQVFHGGMGSWRNHYFLNPGSTGSTKTVSGTTTETALCTVTLPANVIWAGASWRVTAWGTVVQAASTTPTITLRARIGGTTGPVLAANVYTAASNASPTTRSWRAELLLTVQTEGTSGTWFGTLSSRSTITSTGANTSSAPTALLDGTTAQTQDTTVASSAVLTAQWSASSASNSLVLDGWTTEQLH